MPSTLTALPESVLAGAHQLVTPLPVDGATFLPPRIVGWDGYGYLAGDAAAPGLISNGLTLPDVGVSPSVVETVGVSRLAYTAVFGTSWNVPAPSVVGGIVAGDLAVVDCISQENVDPGVPATPGTWTSRGSWGATTNYVPRVTRFFKVMAGGETGTLVTVATASARYHFVARIIRGVNLAAYFAAAAATTASGQGTANPGPNPASITTDTNGAYLEIMAAVNIFPTGADDFVASMVSAGYNMDYSSAPDERGVVLASRTQTTAGVEDPAVFTRSFDNWTVILDAYKPAQNSGITLLVASLASDPTATGVPATEPSLARNEIQTITSTLTTGTFTLTYSGQTTAAINWNDSAATVQTRLRDLSNIGATDVVCTGGPLNLAPVQVEFQSALGNTDVVLMTDSSASVTVVETRKGHPDITFAWEGSVNCPRWLDGVPWETGSAPQINFWSATPASYVAGTDLSVTASDHDTNNTVSAIVLVIADALASNPISDTFGTAVGQLAQSQARFGAITPPLAGSRILAALGISTAAAYTTNPTPTIPARFARAAQVQSDRSVLDLFISPPVAAATDTPKPVQWTGAQDFVTGLMAIQPAGAPGSLTLPQVLADDSQNTWADITVALGALYEILEFDLSGVPANAVITGASLVLEHEADAKSYLRAVLVAIDSAGEVATCSELRSGGYPTDTPGTVQTVATGTWVESSDGASLTDFDRLGVALFSTSRNPAVTSHKVYRVELVVEYEPGGPVVSDVVGPVAAGDPITWEYGSDAGLPQTHVQVRIRHGATQLEGVAAGTYPVNPLAPATGDILYDSGRLAGSLRRTLEIGDLPLSRGSMTVSVRAWTRLASGREIASDWATANFDITGSPLTGGGAPAASPAAAIAAGLIAPSDLVAWMSCENPVGVNDTRDNAEWSLYQPDASNNSDGSPTKGFYYPNPGAGVVPYANADYHFLRDAPGAPPGSTCYVRTHIEGGFANQHASQLWRRWAQAPPDNTTPIPFEFGTRVHFWNMIRVPQAVTYLNNTGGGPPYGFTNWVQLKDPGGSSPPLVAVGGGQNTTSDTGQRWHVDLNDVEQYAVPGPDTPAHPVNEWQFMEIAFEPDSVTPVPLAQTGAGGVQSLTTASFTPPAGARLVVVAVGERGNHLTAFNWDVSASSSAIGPWQTDGDSQVFPTSANPFARNVTVRSAEVGPTPGPMTVTVKPFGPTGTATAVLQVTVFALPNGAADWLHQAPGFGYGDSVATATAALAAAPSGRPLAVFAKEHDASAAWNAPASGWTTVASATQSGIGQILISADKDPDGSVAQSSAATSNYYTAGVILDVRGVGKVDVWVDEKHVAAYTGRTHKDGASQLGVSWGNYGTLLSPAASDIDYSQVGISLVSMRERLASGVANPRLNTATGGVEVDVVAPAGATRVWLSRSTDGGLTWSLSGPYDVTGGLNQVVDFEAPLAEPTVRYQASFDTGPMSETSTPVAIGGDISTAITSWYLIAPGAPSLSAPVDVVEFDIERPRQVVIADGPEETVVLSGPELGRRIQITFRTKTSAEREALDALLTSGEELRLVSILGRSWWVKPGSGIRERMLKWMALPSETTTLRDAHTMTVTLVQTWRG